MSHGNGNAKPPDPSRLRRVVVGATVGTALEWYDFFIYGRVDMEEVDPVQHTIVTAATPAEPRELVMNR
jgi:MHS family shikimate/dehydroshikimate transporter-like MFS transporter